VNPHFVQKTYPGEFPRPSAETVLIEDKDLFVVGTPWGSKDAFKELVQNFRDIFSTSMTDGEATSPFPVLPQLSALGNRLRAAILHSNEQIFRKLNQDAYSSACETLVLAFNRTEMTWIQVGQPHLFLLRQGNVSPLQMALDLSADYLNPTPLPSRLLGVDRQIDIEVKPMNLQAGDKILVLARSTVPGSLYGSALVTETNELAAEQVFNNLVSADSKPPFWVGVLDGAYR